MTVLQLINHYRLGARAGKAKNNFPHSCGWRLSNEEPSQTQPTEFRDYRAANQAKTALDNARKSAGKLSLWLTASLLIDGFAASLAATDN